MYRLMCFLSCVQATEASAPAAEAEASPAAAGRVLGPSVVEVWLYSYGSPSQFPELD